MCPTMCPGGKHPGRSLGATSVTGQNIRRLFYVTDSSTGFKFLVDTGAQVSIIPPSPTDRHIRHTNLILEAVNGTPIRTFGTRSLTLSLGLRRTFRWVFVIAETGTPILGADFLRHHRILVDMTAWWTPPQALWLKALCLWWSRPVPHCYPENLPHPLRLSSPSVCVN